MEREVQEQDAYSARYLDIHSHIWRVPLCSCHSCGLGWWMWHCYGDHMAGVAVPWSLTGQTSNATCSKRNTTTHHACQMALKYIWSPAV